MILAFVVVLSSSMGCKNEEKKPVQVESEEDDRAKRIYVQKRLQAFSVDPERIGVELNSNDFHIYGMAMDWHLRGDQYMTMCVYKNGMTMLYTSDGNKDLEFQHDNIKNAARPFFEKALPHMEKAVQSVNTSLPLDGTFKFYFLTNLGLAVGGDHTAHIEDGSSAWLELFHAANDVITEIRATYVDFVEQG